MRLEGGLGPALVAKRFTDWNIDQLALTILYGRPGTPMPPWRPFLTDGEAYWLATRLKKKRRYPAMKPLLGLTAGLLFSADTLQLTA